MSEINEPQEGEVKKLQVDVHEDASDPESIEKPSKMVVMPGRLQYDTEREPGKPAGYFVRTEGVENTRNFEPGTIEFMVEEMYPNYEILDVVIGFNRDSNDCLEIAERIAEKFNRPEVQRRVRKAFQEYDALKKDFNDFRKED